MLKVWIRRNSCDPGSLNYAQARQIVLSTLPSGSVGAEIGVWKGDLSAEILARTKPSRLHLIDPWQPRTDESHRTAWYSAERGLDIEQIHADVQTRFAVEISSGTVMIHRETSTKALASFPPNSLDWIYIDGDHAYDAVKADLMGAFRVVKPGGLICADDYRRDKWWGDAIVRAVNEFIGAHGDKLAIVFAAQTQVVLRKL